MPDSRLDPILLSRIDKAHVLPIRIPFDLGEKKNEIGGNQYLFNKLIH